MCVGLAHVCAAFLSESISWAQVGRDSCLFVRCAYLSMVNWAGNPSDSHASRVAWLTARSQVSQTYGWGDWMS